MVKYMNYKISEILARKPRAKIQVISLPKCLDHLSSIKYLFKSDVPNSKLLIFSFN